MASRMDFGTVRAIFAAAALVFFAAGAPRAQADAVVRVGKGFAGVFDFVPVDVGMAEGIFKRHGIEIQKFDFNGSSKYQQALAADAIDIGLGSGVELSYVAKGAPDLGVAALMGPPADLVLFTRKEPGLNGPTDLKGKRISVSTVASLTEWLVHELSRQQGWGPQGIITVPLGARQAQIAMLRTEQTDGMAIDFIGGTMIEHEGLGRILLHFDKVAPDFITHAAFARTDFIKQHPDELRRFLAGWFDTIAYMRKHKDDTVRIAAATMHEPADIVATDYDTTMPAFSETGRFEAKPLAVLRRSFVEMGLLPTAPDMNGLYTEKFLPQPAG